MKDASSFRTNVVLLIDEDNALVIVDDHFDDDDKLFCAIIFLPALLDFSLVLY
jgi:hypothetical protein